MSPLVKVVAVAVLASAVAVTFAGGGEPSLPSAGGAAPDVATVETGPSASAQRGPIELPAPRPVHEDVALTAIPAPTPAPTGGAGALADRVAAIDRGDDGAEQVRALRDLLVDEPGLAAAVPELLRAKERSERCRARLLQALQLAGDDSCQQALGTVIEADATLRERALRALGGVATPTAASFDVLWTHARRDCTSAALPAFARAAATVRAADPARHERCCESLRCELRRSHDGARVRAMLQALAAAGDPRAADEAMTFATSSDAGVRCAAVLVLAGSDEPRHELVVRDLLACETDREVRRIGERGLGLRSARR